MPPDPFDLLGLPPRFDLDPREIRRVFLDRSASVHPDHSEEGADETTALNRARDILEDEESRADALLVRLGGPSRNEEKGLPHGFLMEIMQTREEIEAAQQSGDASELSRWEDWAEDRRSAHIESISRRFAALGDPPEPDALRDIRVELNAWRYIERLIEQLDPDAPRPSEESLR